MPNTNPEILSREPLPANEAKWTRLVKVTYRDDAGAIRVWESAERTTRPSQASISEDAVDGVDIVAIVEGEGESEGGDEEDDGSSPSIVLIKQYRPAVGRTVVELPGGLTDPGETPEQTAVRELREETGYVGVALHDDSGDSSRSAEAAGSPLPVLKSPVLCLDPSFGTGTTRLVYLTVDRCWPANRNPQPALEDGELVQDVLLVPLARLHATCRELVAAGCAIDARVGAMAEGLELARLLSWGKDDGKRADR